MGIDNLLKTLYTLLSSVETAILLHNHYGYPLDLLLKEINKRKMVFDSEEFTR